MNRYKLSKAGIDVNDGLRRLNNDKALYEELLLRFTEESYYPRLLHALKKKKTREAFEVAHALKGVTGNLSLVRLHAALLPLVEELRNERIEQAEQFLPDVVSAFEGVVAVLRQEGGKRLASS